MAGDDCIEFVLKFPKHTWRIDAGEIAIDMLVDDFNQRQKLRQ